MPQLDVLTFFMQIFFTFLSFWLSFICYRNWVLPEAYIVLKQRQILVNFIIGIGINLSLQVSIIKLTSLKLISILNCIILILTKDFKYNVLFCNTLFKLLGKFDLIFGRFYNLFSVVFKYSSLLKISKKMNINFKLHSYNQFY